MFVSELGSSETLNYDCSVTNTGQRTGDAVVLGFANSTDPNYPLQKLFDFARVTLAPGETKSVLLTISADHLSTVDERGRRWLRPASFTLRMGDVVSPISFTLDLEGDGIMLEDYSGVFSAKTVSSVAV